MAFQPILQEFCNVFAVDVNNVHTSDTGEVYYDFTNYGGHHVLTADLTTITRMIDIANGHLPNYNPSTPTHKHYAEFVREYVQF